MDTSALAVKVFYTLQCASHSAFVWRFAAGFRHELKDRSWWVACRNMSKRILNSRRWWGEIEEHNVCWFPSGFVQKSFKVYIYIYYIYIRKLRCEWNKKMMTTPGRENIVLAAMGVFVCPEWTHEWTHFLHLFVGVLMFVINHLMDCSHTPFYICVVSHICLGGLKHFLFFHVLGISSSQLTN